MSRYPKLDSDYESKGFCLNWGEDIFPKCPSKDGSMEMISRITTKSWVLHFL